MNFKLFFCLQLPAAPKQRELNIYRRITVCLSFNPYSLRSNMPRSWNDSWLQKSLKTLQRGHWDLPDLSSGCFLHWFFWGAFPGSFQKKLQLLPTKVRVSSDTLSQLYDTEAQVLGGPHCAPVRDMDCYWKCNWTAGTKAWQEHPNTSATGGAQTNVCHFILTSSTLTRLFWTQQQLFQFPGRSVHSIVTKISSYTLQKN